MNEMNLLMLYGLKLTTEAIQLVEVAGVKDTRVARLIPKLKINIKYISMDNLKMQGRFVNLPKTPVYADISKKIATFSEIV
jgi:hypothetical protein